jgi:outer membrane receptor protein involved in Fe transport
LPALRATFSQANSTRFIGTSGLNILDLRGLGTSRTLVLVNGRRHVTSTPGNFDVDTNTIPQALLERVDVITGGSSALYGSDAVAGVVNFVLKRDFEGITGRVQGGISSRGDRGSYLANIVAGRNFLDDRLNVAVALEYTRQEQVLNSQREGQLGTFRGAPGFVTVDTDIQCNSDANGVPIPGSIPFCDPAVVRGSDGIPDTEFRRTGTKFGFIGGSGVVQTSCPAPLAPGSANFATLNPINERRRALVCTGTLGTTGGRLARNFVFLDDGSLIADPITEDLRPVGGGRFGGLTSTGLEGGQLIPESERYSANLLMNFELSPAFQPFLEAKYVRVVANQFSGQPTFVNGLLSPTFSTNNAFLTPQARETVLALTGNAATFGFNRFNFDLGTRSEINERETYRGVLGVRGDLNESGSVNYEIAASFGRTDISRTSGGNILVANFNRAANAVLAPAAFAGTNFVLNSQGQRVVCAVNADASTANDDPACVPINLFGQNNFTQEAADYVLFNSKFRAKAEQTNVVGFVSATTEDFFKLPGGAIGAVLGFEYRAEKAFSDSDDITQSGATFLNAAAEFDPPALELYELFGELRIPLLADLPFAQELTVTGAGRVSDYSSQDELVYAYNGSVVYAPIRDIKFRAGYARSVRAPDLGDLFQTAAQTFAFITDPCNQTVINNNANRVARCAEAGIPTTLTLPDGRVVPFSNVSGANISGFNQGNSNLEPEQGTSITVGAVIQPRFLPGFSLTIDYYDIEIKEAISGLTGQAIVNACYEDPVTINNPFCAAVFRRAPTGNVFSDFAFNGQSGRRFDGLADVLSPSSGRLPQPAFQLPVATDQGRRLRRGVSAGYWRRQSQSARHRQLPTGTGILHVHQ